MKKILPLCESPIKVYSNFAYMLSVLLNCDDAKNWLYSNFIQVKYVRDTEKDKSFIFNYSLGNLTKYFYNLPFLEVRSLKRSFLLKICNNTVEFLCNAIEEGYYIMVVVDEYYLPPRPAYNNKHNLHLILVNGFDTESRLFYSIGFNGGKYEESILEFNDISKAITSNEGNNKGVRDDFCMMYRLQEKNKIEYLQEYFNYFPYKLNLKLIKRSLQEYLYSECTDEHFNFFCGIPSNNEYGISYYGAVRDYLQKYIDLRYEGNVYEVAFHGMLEHKNVMLQRLKYIENNEYISRIDEIIKAYVNLVQLAENSRNLVLKYNLTKNLKCLEKAKKNMDDMHTMEKHAVEELIGKINC